MDHTAELLKRPLYLGDQWWVLDRTLQIYQQLGQKKGRELLLLRDLKVSYPDFPIGAVAVTETPDFLASAAGKGSIGLELVEVYRGAARRKGSPYRERQQAEETVLRLAEELYYSAADHPGPVHALLSWPLDPETERVGPLPYPTDELAGEVARLVRDGASQWADGGRFELGPDGLEGMSLAGVLHGVSARQTGFVGDDGRDSHWGRSLSYTPAIAKVTDIAREIESKDRVYPACREKCEQAWLVAALTGGPSSFEDADDAVLYHSFQSSFDRIVLLCPGSQHGRRAAMLTVAE